jgi:hypothetical protein
MNFLDIGFGIVIGIILTGLFLFEYVPSYKNGKLCITCHNYDIADGHILCPHHGPSVPHRLAMERQRRERDVYLEKKGT